MPKSKIKTNKTKTQQHWNAQVQNKSPTRPKRNNTKIPKSKIKANRINKYPKIAQNRSTSTFARAGVWGSAGRGSGGLPCEGSPCCLFWFTMPWCWSAGGCGGTPPNFGVESSAGECIFPPAFAICRIHNPHPCLSGYWYCHVFVNPQGERNPGQ